MICKMDAYSEGEEWDDASFVIAERLTSVWTAELAAWIGGNGSRADYHDEAITEGLIRDDMTLSSRLMIAQACCIRSMADRVLSALKLI